MNLKKSILGMLLLSMVMLTGCASKLMQPIEDVAQPLPEGQAEVVFYRPSSFGGAVQAVLCNADTSNLQLIGIVSSKTKVAHRTTPGTHMFLITGESGQLVTAHLEANKRYIVQIDPAIGWIKARFEFVPISPQEWQKESTQQSFAKCVTTIPKPEAQPWFEKNKKDLTGKYDSALNKLNSRENNPVIPAHYGINK